MKKRYKNLNEEMSRMKSLFTEERLYGNLVGSPADTIILEQSFLSRILGKINNKGLWGMYDKIHYIGGNKVKLVKDEAGNVKIKRWNSDDKIWSAAKKLKMTDLIDEGALKALGIIEGKSFKDIADFDNYMKGGILSDFDKTFELMAKNLGYTDVNAKEWAEALMDDISTVFKVAGDGKYSGNNKIDLIMKSKGFWEGVENIDQFNTKLDAILKSQPGAGDGMGMAELLDIIPNMRENLYVGGAKYSNKGVKNVPVTTKKSALIDPGTGKPYEIPVTKVVDDVIDGISMEEIGKIFTPPNSTILSRATKNKAFVKKLKKAIISSDAVLRSQLANKLSPMNLPFVAMWKKHPDLYDISTVSKNKNFTDLTNAQKTYFNNSYGEGKWYYSAKEAAETGKLKGTIKSSPKPLTSAQSIDMWGNWWFKRAGKKLGEMDSFKEMLSKSFGHSINDVSARLLYIRQLLRFDFTFAVGWLAYTLTTNWFGSMKAGTEFLWNEWTDDDKRDFFMPLFLMGSEIYCQGKVMKRYQDYTKSKNIQKTGESDEDYKKRMESEGSLWKREYGEQADYITKDVFLKQIAITDGMVDITEWNGIPLGNDSFKVKGAKSIVNKCKEDTAEKDMQYILNNNPPPELIEMLGKGLDAFTSGALNDPKKAKEIINATIRRERQNLYKLVNADVSVKDQVKDELKNIEQGSGSDWGDGGGLLGNE